MERQSDWERKEISLDQDAKGLFFFFFFFYMVFFFFVNFDTKFKTEAKWPMPRRCVYEFRARVLCRAWERVIEKDDAEYICWIRLKTSVQLLEYDHQTYQQLPELLLPLHVTSDQWIPDRRSDAVCARTKPE